MYATSYSVTRAGHRCIADFVHKLDHVADAMPVDRETKLHFGGDFVAFSDGDVPHVVADAGELRTLQIVPSRSGARPGGDAVCTSASDQWPTTTLRGMRNRVCRNPASRSPWAAWFRFMKSMSIVDPRQFAIELRVQVQHGLAQRLQPTDPHLGGREGVHPEDQPRAFSDRRWLRGMPCISCGPGQDSLVDELERDTT